MPYDGLAVGSRRSPRARGGVFGVVPPGLDTSSAVTKATSRDAAHASTETFDMGCVARFAVGQRLGDRYVIQSFLGEGGMGAVYRALDEALAEDVALKVVRSNADRAALRDEVRLAQKVTHRNVCRTYDLETVGDHAFVKMEYVPGVTLAERLHLGILPIDETIAIVRALADGLAAAHARGIVHRDLKPGNVMLDVDGRPVLMDFGLAQRANERGAMAGGTPGYMSPEQLSGDDIDARSDLYGLGCLAYEMLTGERVFGKGSAVELATRHASLAPPDPRAKRPDVPRWLARAVTLLLAKQPEARTRGAALLRSGPWRLPLAVPIAVVVIAIFAIVWALTSRWASADPASPQPPRHAQPTTPAPPVDAVPLGRGSAADHVLVVAADTAYVMSIAGGEPRALLPDVAIASARWTHDGKAFVYATPDGNVYRQRVAGEPLQPVGPSEWLARERPAIAANAR